MQIRTRLQTAKPESDFDKTLEESLLSGWREVSQVINGGLKFSDNFNAQIITVSDTSVADTENTVAHTLKRVPTGYLVLSRNKGGVVYDGANAWTTTNLYIRCTTANTTVKLLVF